MTSINIKIHSRFAGFFRLTTSKENIITGDTGWFPNLITNQGMDWFGTNPPNNNVSFGQPVIGTHCGVGVGTTPPAFTDTQLTSFLAMYPPSTADNVEFPTTATYIPGPPAYWSFIYTYVFASGSVVGNVAEVGVGNTNSSDTQPQLFNHALILDGSGNPTTLPVTAADTLTVTYENRQYLDLTDDSVGYQINDVTYAATRRRISITSTPRGLATVTFNLEGGRTTMQMGVGATLVPVTANNLNWTSFTTSGDAAFSSYISGTYTIAQSNVFSTSQNVSGNINAFKVDNFILGSWQYVFTPTFTKNNVQTLTINSNLSWARYAP